MSTWDAKLLITVFSSAEVSSHFPPRSCFRLVGTLSIGKEEGGFEGNFSCGETGFGSGGIFSASELWYSFRDL